MDLEQAKRLFSEALVENPKGALCPCCLRTSAIYRYTILPHQGLFLIRFYQEYGQQFGNCQDLRRKWTGLDHRQETKLRYWDLFEPQGGNSHVREWRVTDLGVAFILEEATVPKRVHILNNEVVKHSGEDVSIRDVLKPKYDYDLL